MINIDFSSAKVTIDTTSAVPAVAVGQKRAGLHLTKGYISPDTVPATNNNQNPVNLTGEVDVFVDTKDEVDQVLNGSWFFGFLQVARIKEMSASWEGRRNGEGSVSLFVFGFPVSNDVVALDSDPTDQPFFSRVPHAGFARRQQPGQRRLVHVSAGISDHPNYRDALVTANSLTKTKNFLHLLNFNVEFTSIFVGRDGNGPIQPIAHLEWILDLAAEFKWRRGQAKGFSHSRPIVSGLSTTGAPSDGDVKTIVGNPGPPFAKAVGIDTWKQAMLNPRMRQEDVKRSLLLPRDFFQ